MKTSKRSSGGRWRKMFAHRKRFHDPMLVFNMSIFNFADEWTRTLNRLKGHQRGI